MSQLFRGALSTGGRAHRIGRRKGNACGQLMLLSCSSRMSQMGGDAYFAVAMGTPAMVKIPVLPEATFVGALSALLRRSRSTAHRPEPALYGRAAAHAMSGLNTTSAQNQDSRRSPTMTLRRAG